MEVNYPIPIWNPAQVISATNPVYAHNKKQHEELLADGFTDQYSNYPHRDWPRTVYNASGHAERANNPEHEQELLERGYTRKPVARKIVELPQPKMVGGTAVEAEDKTTGRVDALEEQVGVLQESIDELKSEAAQTKSTLDEILKAVTDPDKRRRSPKTDAA